MLGQVMFSPSNNDGRVGSIVNVVCRSQPYKGGSGKPEYGAVERLGLEHTKGC